MVSRATLVTVLDVQRTRVCAALDICFVDSLVNGNNRGCEEHARMVDQISYLTHACDQSDQIDANFWCSYCTCGDLLTHSLLSSWPGPSTQLCLCNHLLTQPQLGTSHVSTARISVSLTHLMTHSPCIVNSPPSSSLLFGQGGKL